MERLKQLRVQSGHSYQSMAEILRISKTYYWQLENKKRRLSYAMAIKIADIFSMKPDELFYDDFVYVSVKL